MFTDLEVRCVPETILSIREDIILKKSFADRFSMLICLPESSFVLSLYAGCKLDNIPASVSFDSITFVVSNLDRFTASFGVSPEDFDMTIFAMTVYLF